MIGIGKKSGKPEDPGIKDKHMEYYEQYKQQYDSILASGMRFLTVSPRATEGSFQKVYDKHVIDFIKPLQHIANDFMAFAEFTDKYRLHWHIVYTLKDKIKLAKYIYKLTVQGIQTCDLKGQPLYELRYLIKKHKKTKRLLKDNRPMITRQNILDDTAYERKRMLESIAAEKVRKQLERPITPNWMKRSDSTDSLNSLTSL